MGRSHGRGVERRPSRRGGHRRGDPGRPDERRGHRRRDHCRQRPVPRLQHGAGGGAPVPAPGRARVARQLRGRRRLRRRPHGRGRRAVPLHRRRALPDAVEGQPGDDHLQPGRVRGSRHRPRQPAARHLRRVPGDRPDARRIEGGVQAAIWPSPAGRVLPAVVRLLPDCSSPRADSSSSRTGQATFASEDGFAVANFWRSMYDAGLSPREAYTGDAFADAESAMSIVGPWAIAVYGEDIDWGVVPVPTAEGTPAEEIQTFSDEKSIGMFTACENQATAWDVLKFATSEEQDGALLEATGQMPMRTDLRRDLPGLLRGQPRLRGLRRAGRPHRRGAQRGQLDRGLADVPRCVVGVGDLRRQRPGGGVDGRRRRRSTSSSQSEDDDHDGRHGQPARAPAPGRSIRRRRREARTHPAAPATRRLPVRVAVGRLLRRDLRLPARVRRVDVVLRLLLRRAGCRRRPAIRRVRQLLGRPHRRGRAPVVQEHRRLPRHQRAAHGDPGDRPGDGVERRRSRSGRSSAPPSSCPT